MHVEKEVTKQNDVSVDPPITTPAWVERSELETKIRIEIRKEYEVLLQLWKDSELNDLAKNHEKIIAEGLQKLFEKWVEEQKPPTNDDIQKLLSQEYETFTLKVDYLNDENEEKSDMFTIRELPQTLEIKFFQSFQKRIIDKSQALAALAQQEIDQPFEQKVKSVLTLVSEGFDVLADAVAIILNPFGKKAYVTREWVQNNISSDRQWNIIDAQIKVNKLKDFFSKVSLSGQQTQTMMGNVPRFQQLQQLARS